MKILWFSFFIHMVAAQVGFGRSYLGNSRLCHQWDCINKKLSLPDLLPPKDQFKTVLSNLLPEGAWQDVIAPVLDICYGKRPRRYTNTCPGQALLHCVVDNLIDKCPEEYLRKRDACASLSSIAGFNYMFSQSCYENLEENLSKERRPTWFLKNYFNSKRCNLPSIFKHSDLQDCGLTALIHYNVHKAQQNSISIPTTSTTSEPNAIKVDSISQANDPLDCCDISDFISKESRSRCDFKLTWKGEDRLSIDEPETTESPMEATTSKQKSNDVKIVPVSCEKETCVFSKLNIIKEDNTIDMDAFDKLLNNFTDHHSMWRKAKARVVTKCLKNPIREYEAGCEINKVLACTFDVLTENCPHSKKFDKCKHNKYGDSNMCQISSSKFRPKNRRQFCGLPNIVSHDILTECDVKSISNLEYVPEVVTTKPNGWYAFKYSCKDSTPSTKCLLKETGILNKYGFMDYFKMKDKIRQFTNNSEWDALSEMYMSAFTNLPMYGQHCSTPKRLLNVIDTMLMTCPISKRKKSEQCMKIFDEMINLTPKQYHYSKEKLEQVFKHFYNIYLPTPAAKIQMPTPKLTQPVKKYTVTSNPSNNYGFLNSKSAPSVKILNLKTPNITKRPVILLPVYKLTGRLTYNRPYNNGVLRDAPLA